jgi:hypothetical protein
MRWIFEGAGSFAGRQLAIDRLAEERKVLLDDLPDKG